MRQVFDEPLETAVLWRLIRPGSTFVDVGANRGWYSMLAAHRVGPSGRVLSFEPDARPRRQLVENIALNQFENRVTLYECALADEDGTGVFVESQEGALSHLKRRGDTERGRPVATRSLRSILMEINYPAISVVKVDVEGAEERVLAGVPTELQVVADTVFMVEVEEGHLERFGSTLETVTARLPDHEFRWICWRHGCLESIRDACRDAGRNVLGLPAHSASSIEQELFLRSVG